MHKFQCKLTFFKLLNMCKFAYDRKMLKILIKINLTTLKAREKVNWKIETWRQASEVYGFRRSRSKT